MEIEESNNHNSQLSKEKKQEKEEGKEKERNMDKMKKIYNSVINDSNLKKHINFNRDKRIKFIQEYPYNNFPHNETYVFSNLCMFSDLCSVNGYITINDNLKAIDFNGNFKKNEKMNFSQRCLLPEKLFYQKYDYKNIIFPLDQNSINEYLLQK